MSKWQPDKAPASWGDNEVSYVWNNIPADKQAGVYNLVFGRPADTKDYQKVKADCYTQQDSLGPVIKVQ